LNRVGGTSKFKHLKKPLVICYPLFVHIFLIPGVYLLYCLHCVYAYGKFLSLVDSMRSFFRRKQELHFGGFRKECLLRRNEGYIEKGTRE